MPQKLATMGEGVRAPGYRQALRSIPMGRLPERLGCQHRLGPWRQRVLYRLWLCQNFLRCSHPTFSPSPPHSGSDLLCNLPVLPSSLPIFSHSGSSPSKILACLILSLHLLPKDTDYLGEKVRKWKNYISQTPLHPGFWLGVILPIRCPSAMFVGGEAEPPFPF